VHFVEVIDVLVLLVLENVEAHAARLVSFGTEGIHLNRLQEALARLRLHPDLHPHRQHRGLVLSAARTQISASCADVDSDPNFKFNGCCAQPRSPEWSRSPSSSSG